MKKASHIPNLEYFLQDVYSRQGGIGTSATSVTSDSVSVQIAIATSGLGNPADIDRLSNGISAISQQVSVLSQQISVLSQQLSVLSAGLGGVQMRVVGNVQGISATALINVSGLSASVTSAAVYQVEGMVLYQMSVADTVGFGLTFPVGTIAGVRYQGTSAVGQGAGIAAFGNEGASGSIVYSVVPAAALSTNILRIDGVFTMSTTAGTIQLQARVSATANPVNIQKGSYLRAYKVA